MESESIPFDESTEIFVGFYDSVERRDLSRPIDLAALADDSIQALNKAMKGIKSMTKGAVTTIRSINIMDRPDTVEMKFGLKLTSDANVFIVGAGTEAQIEVTLTWNSGKDEKNTIREAELPS